VSVRWNPVAVRVTIDSAGRLIVPKALRDVEGVELELLAVDGRLEISIPSRVVVEQRPHGVRFAADTSDHLSTEQCGTSSSAVGADSRSGFEGEISRGRGPRVPRPRSLRARHRLGVLRRARAHRRLAGSAQDVSCAP
jgi:hypothetical protein